MVQVILNVGDSFPPSQDSKKKKPLVIAKGFKKNNFEDDIDFNEESDGDQKAAKKGGPA